MAVQTAALQSADAELERVPMVLIRMGMPRGPLRRKAQEKIPQPQTLVA